MSESMSEFSGILRMPTEPDDPGLPVTIEVTDTELAIAADVGELGRWLKDSVIIVAQDDAFHVRAEGEEVLLNVQEDAWFAVAVGLTTGPPDLRRRMSMILREQD